MSEEQTQELVTKIDVQPDLAGLLSFQAEIDKATQKVNELNRAIRQVNELKPKSRYAPPVNNPAATAAAAGLAGGFGANLAAGTGLAPIIKKATEEVIKKGIGGGGRGGGLVPFSGGLTPSSGGALALYRSPVEDMDLSGYRAPDADFTIGSGSPVAKEAVEAKKTAARRSSGMKMPGMMRLMMGGLGASIVSKQLDKVADSMDRIQSKEKQLERLPQTLGSGKDAFLELQDAASQVRGDGDAFISTYTNMATATEKLGLSQKETIKATQGLVSSLQLGGGSKEAVTNALYQMGQAFSSDRFGGDEFRSFMEAIGTQAPAVAKAFGTDVKGLRAMSTAGKLTAETMVKAFEKLADQNIELMRKQGWTWGQVTTVMGNDWEKFKAKMDGDQEWERLMNYVSNNVTPVFRDAEQAVAKWWNSLVDESKEGILLGILAAIGAGFAALAISVLAATWPFLAIGAAVWFAYEMFVEFKAWMDGKGGTIFDSIFGSFDEFEKRYPNIVKALKAIGKAADSAAKNIGNATPKGTADAAKELATPSGLFGNAMGFVKDKALPGLDWLLGNIMAKPQQLHDLPLLPPSLTNNPSLLQQQGGSPVITNSGNTTIQVATPGEAAEVANKRDAAFITHYSGDSLDNMAEAGGWM